MQKHEKESKTMQKYLKYAILWKSVAKRAKVMGLLLELWLNDVNELPLKHYNNDNNSKFMNIHFRQMVLFKLKIANEFSGGFKITVYCKIGMNDF